MKRYSIVRVDNNCPEYIEDFKCYFPDNSTECMKCNHHRYGDTKEQLEQKVAQIIFKAWFEDKLKPNCEKIPFEIAVAKEIVEFLGVEDDYRSNRKIKR